MSFSKIPSVHILSIAFDGSNFACLDSNGVRVFLLDKHFKFLEIINLKYKYSSICYDVTDNCYWAIANNRASTIYQLDNNFKETNKIYLRRPNNANAIATGLSYNKLEDTIWISFSTGIGYAQKVNRKTNYTDNQSKIRFNRAVLSLPNGELISYLEDCNGFLEFCNETCCKDITKLIPEGFIVEDMCMISCSENDDYEEYTNCALLLDRECNKFIWLRFCLTFRDGDLVKIESLGIEELNLLVSEDDCEDIEIPHCDPCKKPCHDPCKDHCDPCKDHCEPCKNPCHDPCKDHCDHSKKPCCDPCKDHCEPCKNPCHDSCKDHCDHSKKPCCDPCKDHCEPCKKPCHDSCKDHCDPCKDHCDPCCPCDKYKCCCDAKSKIMQSIALEEAALAHILNAEGEKIQKAVAEFESTDKLIAVNESVKDTIIHITQLETQLYLKLESVRKDNCKNRYCHID